MKLAVMQPYFLPYIGYFQLIKAVDLFIIYDNIKYTKKGWINRNRYLQNGKDALFSIPMQSGSDSEDIRDRKVAAEFNRGKLLNQLTAAYRNAPFFGDIFPLIKDVVQFADVNLFRFLHHSLARVCEYLQIETEIAVSSAIPIDHSLKSQDKVMAICNAVGANIYINAIGGMELYSKESFQEQGIELRFISAKPFEYKQFDNQFLPWLSIVDVMMFNPLPVISEYLSSGYELIQGG